MSTTNDIGFSRSARRRMRMQPNTSTTAVGITGTFSTGQTMTANPGAWPPAGAVVTYQWVRGKGQISGATAQAYVVQAQDLGRDLGCIITATSASQGQAFITLRVRR